MFFDLLRVEVPVAKTEARAPIDLLFEEACEPGSIEVIATQPNLPVPGTLGAYVDQHCHVVVSCPDSLPKSLSVVVTLAGVRRNVTARFPVFTEKQARRNRAFWDQALREGGQLQGAPR